MTIAATQVVLPEPTALHFAIDIFPETAMAPSMIERYFLAHPRTAGQSYAQHQRFAWRFSRALFGAAFAALIHGMFPSIFPTAASETIRRLHAELDARHDKNDL